MLRAGDLFLLPAKVPHSPRRGDGSWTFVIERRRLEQETDRFIWPCENCGNNLYEANVRFDDPGGAVNEATNALKSDASLATGKKCGAVLEI